MQMDRPEEGLNSDFREIRMAERSEANSAKRIFAS